MPWSSTTVWALNNVGGQQELSPREMAQTSGFDPTLKVKTCFDCKMFDVANWVAHLSREGGQRDTFT